MKLSVPLRWAAGCMAALATSAVFAQAVIVAPFAPPPPRVEVMPAPRAGYVWDQGHWHWRHGRYVWIPGHWQVVRVGYLGARALGGARPGLALGAGPLGVTCTPPRVEGMPAQRILHATS